MDEPAAQTQQQQPKEEQVRAQVPGRRRRVIPWMALAGYSLLLGYRAWRHATGGESGGLGLWELQDANRFLAWLDGVLVAALWEFACLVPVGFVAALVAPRGSGRFRRFLIRLSAASLAGAVAVSVYLVAFAASGRPALVLGLVFPLLGCFFGVWMGTTWLRGRRACLWFVPKVVLSIVLAAVLLGIPVWLSLERTPLSFEAAQVTSVEKRRLVDLFHGKNPLALDDNEARTLRLTEHDLNVLLSWGLSLGSPARKAGVGLALGSAGLQASVGVPLGGARHRYLNLELAGSAGIQDGALRLMLSQCRLGCLEVPRRFLDSLSSVVAARLSLDRRWKPFLDATHAMRIEPAFVELTYGRVRLPPELRRELFGPTAANEEVLAATQAQIDHLLAVIRPLRPAQRTFGLCFETVFTLAQERSVGRDAIKENQAGIFALGILLGHPRIEEILGLTSAGTSDGRPAARHNLIPVVLRGRSDWTRHFCVSAVLAVLSDEAISGAAGLLKEELDGDTGGSGFSFSDLLADRAGTTFAIQATRDQASAQAMQERLAGGFRIDEFFPPAADLPEGLPDAMFQARYGGVGGEGYLRLIEEIEHRVAACAAYR